MNTTTDLDDIAALAARSVALIESLQHEAGAYPASPTFSAYQGYSWFRDGAFIADGMSAAGATESASRFFDWCDRMLSERRAQIAEIVAAEAGGTPLPDEAMLATRFTLDGREGDDGWWDFQTLQVIEEGMEDAQLPRDMQQAIKDRLKVYMLANPLTH